ncbi:unnamed protein product [Triticum turgidum subsp. durum]|uniref:Germin-like protein n=1 Tax=Triticum turgidum subsp. durum TaxID=4567 RepID=A0A9R0XL55_TRITD|nr:unnamed protein product [Triticum turgidum subsp. durum]
MARSRVSIMSSRVLLLIVAVAALVSACVADPEPVQDFCVAAATNGSADHPSYPGFPCKPASAVVSDDFFFAGTAGTFYSKVVREGESFVIPRGMVHFQFNTGKESARAVTVFNSQLPGVVLAAPSLFGADPEIPDAVLSKSFQVDGEIIKLLKSKFRT